VSEHISSFLVVESHYARKNTSKIPGLNTKHQQNVQLIRWTVHYSELLPLSAGTVTAKDIWHTVTWRSVPSTTSWRCPLRWQVTLDSKWADWMTNCKVYSNKPDYPCKKCHADCFKMYCMKPWTHCHRYYTCIYIVYDKLDYNNNKMILRSDWWAFVQHSVYHKTLFYCIIMCALYAGNRLFRHTHLQSQQNTLTFGKCQHPFKWISQKLKIWDNKLCIQLQYIRFDGYTLVWKNTPLHFGH